MNFATFLDLVHRYIIMGMVANQVKPEEVERMNRQLIGPPRVDRPSLIDERAGFVPPAWWRGDEYASKSAILARATMKRTRR